MPLPPALARWLASQGQDAVHASTIGLDRAADSEIIAYALSDSRTVVTADLDFPRLLALTGAVSPSLVLFRGGDWSDLDVIGRMRQILLGFSESDLTTSILVVERHRIRRRGLPIA